MTALATTLTQATEFHRAGNLGQAEQLYRQVVAADPQCAAAWRFLGLLAVQTRTYREAVNCLHQAIALDPTDAGSCCNLGTVYASLGQLDEAREAFQQAVVRNPQMGEAHGNLGLLLKKQGRFEAAAVNLRQAIQWTPKNNIVLERLLGHTLLEMRDFAAAAESLSKVVHAQPHVAAAHNDYGTALEGLGNLDEAAASYAEALRIDPDHTSAHCNLGNVRQKQDRLDEAAACYRQATRCKPGFADGWYNLSLVLKKQGQLAEADEHLQRAIELKPDFADALFARAELLAEQGRDDEAIAFYERGLRYKPDQFKVLNNLGNAWRRREDYVKAAACYEQALAIEPNFFAALNNLGFVLMDQGRLAEAETALQRAVALRPESAEVRNNLATILLNREQPQRALIEARQALEMEPDRVGARMNVGGSLYVLGQWKEARQWVEKALELEPDHIASRFLLAQMLLAVGEYPRGFAVFEWRRKSAEIKPRGLSQPEWDGGPLVGKRIYIYPEQGLGDTIQFVRYAAELKRRGGTVIVECQPSICRLVRTCPSVSEVVPRGGCPPDFDVHASLMSLPWLCGTTIGTIPAEIPYLSAEPERVDYWRHELTKYPQSRLKVGVVWQGDRRYRRDVARSIPLEQFVPLLRQADVQFFSLQKGPGSEQIAALPGVLPIVDLASRLDLGADGFIDTAAVMQNLDLVITSDTSTPHLAGALGVPTWVALMKTPDWRWMLEGENSPWYPTLRLFRQRSFGDWPEVFERMAQELTKWNPPPKS